MKHSTIWIIIAVLVFFGWNGYLIFSRNRNLSAQSKKVSPLLQDRSLKQKDTFNGEFAESIPVLLYHGEGGETGNISTAAFDDQIEALKKDGWKTVKISDFEAFMRGEKKLPAKSFLLTFDDGRTDSVAGADPVLTKTGFSAVMFVISGFSLPDLGIPISFYLNKDQLKSMLQGGRWEIQSHSKEAHRIYGIVKDDAYPATTTGIFHNESGVAPGHFISNKFIVRDKSGKLRFETDDEFASRIKNDLSLAKKTLEKNFNISINTLAYPLNDFGQGSINYPDAKIAIDKIVPEIYDFAFYQTWPSEGESWNYPGQSYMTRRIEASPDWTGKDLLNALRAGEIKPLPFNTKSFGNEWLPSWGNVTLGKNLSLQSLKDSTGAEATLEGSRLWTDYTFTAEVKPKPLTEVSLIARRFDSKNSVACDFSGNRVYVKEIDNGVQKELTNAPYGDTNNLGIKVEGNNVTCLSNNNIMASSTFNNPKLFQGGISIQVWNQVPGTAGAVVNHVDVLPITK